MNVVTLSEYDRHLLENIRDTLRAILRQQQERSAEDSRERERWLARERS
jgi:hypothetical protein